MRKLIIAALLLISTSAFSQITLPGAMRQAGNLLRSSPPDHFEMSAGLKDALELGINAGTQRLSAQNGFLQNKDVKILFPSDARKIEKTLRGMGLNKLCDDFILSLNQAAEQAVIASKPIFANALKEMTFRDVSEVLLSEQKDAATQYFKGSTSNELIEAFSPHIEKSLASTGATKYWEEIVTRINQIPLVKAKIDTDLTAFAAQQTVNGLFFEIAREELRIRTNTSLRTTPAMKKAFAYAQNSQNSIK